MSVAAWMGAALVIESSGVSFPLMMPTVPEEDQAGLAGYSITLCCPVGCTHTVAAEATWDLTLETAAFRLEAAAFRLEAAPGWTNGLLVVGFYPQDLGACFAQVKEGCDAFFRGRSH